MEEKNKSRKNSVRIVGFLKENLLEVVANKDGVNVIKGSIIISTQEDNSHKVQFYAAEYDRNGEPNSDFAALLELLPEKTISVASYLKENPTATKQLAYTMASKIWVMARFDEFTTRAGERESTMILLKGYRAGFKTATDSSPFVPTAQFTCDVYIDSISEEYDENGDATGRYNLVGLIPSFDKSVNKVTFVCPTEDNIAAYISSNYHASDTATITGDLVSTVEVETKEVEDNGFFGRQINEGQKVTKFIREFRIYGGSKTPIKQGQSGCITTKEIKEGLVNRDQKIAKASANSKNRAQGQSVSAAPARGFADAPAETSSGKVNTDEFDF